MRRVLLFDVMGTLVHDPFFEEVPAFFGVSFEALLPQLEPGPWVQFERGEIDQETLLRRFFRDGRAFDHAGLVACVRAAYRYLPGVEALLTDLSAACAGEGVSMHTLSNYPPWYRMIEERLRLSDYVLWSFVSCHTGVRKPDPEAYLGAAGASLRACAAGTRGALVG